MTEKELWEQHLAAQSGDTDKPYEAWCYGSDTPDKLAALTASGIKTATRVRLSCVTGAVPLSRACNTIKHRGSKHDIFRFTLKFLQIAPSLLHSKASVVPSPRCVERTVPVSRFLLRTKTLRTDFCQPQRFRVYGLLTLTLEILLEEIAACKSFIPIFLSH